MLPLGLISSAEYIASGQRNSPEVGISAPASDQQATGRSDSTSSFPRARTKNSAAFSCPLELRCSEEGWRKDACDDVRQRVTAACHRGARTPPPVLGMSRQILFAKRGCTKVANICFREESARFYHDGLPASSRTD